MLENERRSYIRATCICEAEIILDAENDETAEVSVIDLAAGGLKFVSWAAKQGGKCRSDDCECNYVLGNIYPLKLSINEVGIDIDDISAEIKIRRVELDDDGIHCYGASFENLTVDQSIRIDEILQFKRRHRYKEDEEE